MNYLLERIQTITPLETVAVLATFISVILTVRNHIGTWFWGLIAVFAYGWMFYQQKNYGNACLNLLYFAPIQIYGWYAWLRFGPRRNDDLPVTAMSARSRIGCVLITAGLAALAAWLLGRFTPDPFPLADGVTTAFSMTAQYLEVFKRFENWLLWIAADIIYVFYLFPKQHDYLSTILYAALLVLATMGLRNWLRLMAASQPGIASPASFIVEDARA